MQIREEIDHYGIRIYQFPECDSDEDEEFKLQDQALKVGWAPAAPGPGGAHCPWCQASPLAAQHGGFGLYRTGLDVSLSCCHL